MENDILLLKLIKEGDTHAFRHLFDLYFVALCRYMNLYLKNQQEAEEAALDIFTHFWTHREGIEIKLSLKAYLFQSARNKCLNVIRDRKTTVGLDEAQGQQLAEAESASLEVEELYLLVREAVCSLPERCAEVFRKSRVEELTNQEIADQMHISVKTVEGQITKALKRIKEFLGDKYSYLF
ncbi:MAG: RNA polymerase sigma-70 factor [Mediterranea sp.]|jgi:RNA polymerase sigma-70 factor (ECF subfamily)|nr:RNA polymerase sigma-70 factor [Mediterranea sp.]